MRPKCFIGLVHSLYIILHVLVYHSTFNFSLFVHSIHDFGRVEGVTNRTAGKCGNFCTRSTARCLWITNEVFFLVRFLVPVIYLTVLPLAFFLLLLAWRALLRPSGLERGSCNWRWNDCGILQNLPRQLFQRCSAWAQELWNIKHVFWDSFLISAWCCCRAWARWACTFEN